MRSIWLSAVLATAMVLAPLPAVAADPAAEQAQAEFEDGTLRYETADYAGAVEAFRRAFSKANSIEDPELREAASNAALFNMARAHIEAYKRDKDESRLVQAREILEKFIAAQEGEIGEELDADGLLAKIDKLEGKETPPPPSAKRSAPNPVADTEGPEPIEAPPPKREPKPKKERRPGVALIGAGGGLAGLSIVGFGILGAGAAKANAAEADFLAAPDVAGRDAADAEGRQANGLVITGTVLAVALLGTGAALIGVGVKKKRAAAPGKSARQWHADARGVHF